MKKGLIKMTTRTADYFENLIAAEKNKIKELKKKQKAAERAAAKKAAAEIAATHKQRDDYIVQLVHKLYEQYDLYALTSEQVTALITTGTLPENEQVPALLNPEATTA